MIMNFLFVCRGNVGRSQIARAFFEKFKRKDDSSECAGTKVYGEEGQIIRNLGESAQNIIKAMKEEGIDLSEKRRKQVTDEIIKRADKIILMAERENISDELFNNPKSIFWDIEDPINVTYKNVVKIRDLIKKRVKSLITSTDLS